MQVDYGFQHRNDRVTSILSYGRGYAEAFATWAERLAGTPYALPPRAIGMLVDYYLDGICRASAFGTFPDPGAMNRGLSRPGALTPYDAELPLRLLSATDYRGRSSAPWWLGGTAWPRSRRRRPTAPSGPAATTATRSPITLARCACTPAAITLPRNPTTARAC